MIRRILVSSGVLAACLCSPACNFLSAEPDPTRFAVLASVDELPDAPRGEPLATGLRVGLGPIELPEYLKGLEIQTRADGTRLEPSLHQRWGEPLDRGLERVLSIDLARVLGAKRVVLHPWYSTDRPDVQVRIVFSRFEREAPRKVVLHAHWSVRHLGSDAPPLERETRLERATSGDDGPSTALALSEALAELAREIAATWPQPPARAGG